MSEEPYAVYREGDRIVEIRREEFDVEDPRENYDHLGIMWCWHNRYNLGDVKDVWVNNDKKCYEKRQYNPSHFDSFSEMADALYKNEKPILVLPLYLYDHSGISMSVREFGDRWDSGCVGLIWFPRERLSDLGYKIACKPAVKRVEACLQAEVKEYDAYLTVDVFGWVAYDVKDGEKVEESEESCWGFYGLDDNLKYMLSEGFRNVMRANVAREFDLRDLEEEQEEAKQQQVDAQPANL